MTVETDLAIITWLWGTKYSDDYVHRLVLGIRKHVTQPHRILLVTERERAINLDGLGIERHAIKDPQLLQERGCFVRLRMFDPGWQHARQIAGRLVCIDLDCVIVANIDHLFYRQGDFHILQGVNSSNPCPYNGSLMMLRANTNSDVWHKFSLEHAYRLPYYEFPDDQGWIWQQVSGAHAYLPGRDGVYAYRKPGWPPGDGLPENAKIVVFPGSRDPAQIQHLPWVREHWLNA